MIVIKSLRDIQGFSSRCRQRGKSVGLVPTMGALHEGHLSLVRRAARDNDVVVVSIFVNPSQFGPQEDYSRYPRPWGRDWRILLGEKVDVVFRPAARAMYPKGFDTWVSVERLSRPLCGAFRPGHFRGVATVVAQLFQLVQPHRAYFGMKDFQQVRVIEQMVRDLHFSVQIVRCPTLREPDGLALSSRNRYLTTRQRRTARVIPLALQRAGEVIRSKKVSPKVAERAGRALLKKIPGAKVDYFSLVDPDTLEPLARGHRKALVAVAVWVGRARLIDNIIVARRV